jgi:hypothetical protein
VSGALDLLELLAGIVELGASLLDSAERRRARRALTEWANANGYRHVPSPDGELATRAQVLARHCLPPGERTFGTTLCRRGVIIFESSLHTDTRTVADCLVAGALHDPGLPDRGWCEVVPGEPAQVRMLPSRLQVVAPGRLTPHLASKIIGWLEQSRAQYFSSGPFR